MNKFIINKHENPFFVNCILEVIGTEGSNIILSYQDFDFIQKFIKIPEEDGEYYTEEVIERRRRDLAIRNVLSLMSYNNLTIKDLDKNYESKNWRQNI
jgi:hypothetical protein